MTTGQTLPITPEMEASIVADYIAGFTFTQIQHKYHIGFERLRAVLVERGVTIRKPNDSTYPKRHYPPPTLATLHQARRELVMRAWDLFVAENLGEKTCQLERKVEAQRERCCTMKSKVREESYAMR